MLITEKQMFAAEITGLSQMYGKAMSQFEMTKFWEILKAFAWEDVKAALDAHLRNPDTGQFMPKIADIVRYIEGGGQIRSLQAWTKVIQAIGSAGPYASVAFDDPLIHVTLSDMQGWIKLCSISDKETPFIAKEFEQRYTAYVRRQPPSYPKKLIGLTEQENSRNGYATKLEPTYIGNVEIAKEVYQGNIEKIRQITQREGLPALEQSNEQQRT